MKGQMKNLKGANDDLRRQIMTMMELQGQMMKMTKEEDTKKKSETRSAGEEDDKEA